MGKDWIRTIVAFYEEFKPVFIASPVSIHIDKNKTGLGRYFLQVFQALDFMTLQGITGAAVFKKVHSMCNGANLAYEKKVFAEVDGFTGIDHLASGDDMLLMHKIFSRYPERVMYLKSADAIVSTGAEDDLKGFFNQRIRWASKAGQYDDKRIFPVLFIVYLLNLLLLILPIIALTVNSMQIIIVWGLLLLFKTVIELFFLYPVASFFNRTKLLWWFPLMQPFHILYTVIAGWLGTFGSYQWKERKVK
jgi:cellulose synthase/poly-beta-1,6-N-acetylglucosamine synthase-like glycosyltransferase